MKILSTKTTRTLWHTKFYKGGDQISIEYSVRQRVWKTFLGIPYWIIKEEYVQPRPDEIPSC